jgi:hypothetical protein
VFAAHPSAAFLTKDLCEILHPSLPTRRHIAETNRQARKVVAADPHWTCELSADQRQVVFFNRVNERSVEAAQTLLAPKPKQPRMRRPSRPRRKFAHRRVRWQGDAPLAQAHFACFRVGHGDDRRLASSVAGGGVSSVDSVPSR